MTLSPLPQNEKVVIDGTECYANAVFLDVDGNLYTPSSLQYRVDDLTNGINVVPWTSVSASQQVVVTLNSTVNTMNAASALTERRQFMLQIGIPGGTFQNAPTTYSLVRRTGTP